jgi:hypothetical protein
MSIKVSIITPSFNQGRFIRQTIESVLNQDYENLEYIVIDGGSTDETLNILREYQDRLKWISEPDRGQADAINKGFKMATGDIVAWLNSDDTYEPGAVSAVIPYFKENPDIALIYGEGNIINKNDEKVSRFENTIPFNLWVLIHVWDYIMQPAAFFRKDALEQAGYLDTELYWTMDWDLWLKLAMKHDVLYINTLLANSREYTETKTSTGGIKRINEIRELMSRYSGLFYTEGFWLYYYDWLSKCFSDPAVQSGITSNAINFLNNLPIPDSDNYCPPKTYFCIRKDRINQRIRLCYKGSKEFTVTISVNGILVKKVSFETAGTQEIELDLTVCVPLWQTHIVLLQYNPDFERPELKAYFE